MASIYEALDALCKEHHICGAKMCIDLGMSKSFMTELRKGRAKSIKVETAAKIADYFGVSVDSLLGNGQKEPPAGKASISDDDLKVALSAADIPLTDAQLDEVKKFVQFVQERDQNDRS